jgi:hypothetical protein
MAKRDAMHEPRAQRTLVKSPPELWAEVSDVDHLARHLGEFGEIRITRLEPETTVAWEGDRACGTVALEPSGWGTKVTLTAKLAEEEVAAEPVAVAAEPVAVAAEPVAVAADPVAVAAEPPAPEPPTAAAEPEPVAPKPEPVAVAAEPVAVAADPVAVAAEPPAPEPPTAAAEPEPVAPKREPVAPEPPKAAAEPEPVAPEPEADEAPKVGFFARLFGRRRNPAAVVEVEPEPGAEPLAAEPEPLAAEPEPLPAEPEAEAAPLIVEPEPEVEPEPVAAEPEPVVEEPQPAPLDAERAEAILTGVLDDLGSAHHRPFSRS